MGHKILSVRMNLFKHTLPKALVITRLSRFTLAATLLFLLHFSLATSVSSQTTPINLITNGGFEANLSGWIADPGVTFTSTDPHNGVQSVHFVGNRMGTLSRQINAQAGKTYKVTLYIKINSGTTCSGDCWGSFYAMLDNYPGIPYGGAVTPYLTPQNRPVGVWFEETFKFTAPQTGSGSLVIKPSGGTGWKWDIQVDDVMFFETVLPLLAPTISFVANPDTLTTLPGTLNFTSTEDDPDGVIQYFFWDFGDGGKSNLASPNHTYAGNGTFVTKLIVYDDDGLSATAQRSIIVADPSYPTITINSPASSPFITTNPVISITGTATGTNLNRATWSTDRQQSGTATGTTNWNFTTNLAGAGGLHRFLISAIDANGRLASKTIIIDYHPSTRVNIHNGSQGVTQNAATVDQYDKFETTFTLDNSVASNPYFPYETNLPPGMETGNGITVEGLFTTPSGTVLNQPGFWYQPYERRTHPTQVLAQGTPVWKIRFAPTETGTWTYQIRVTDASGTTTLTDMNRLRFTVNPPSNPVNHGFLQPSKTDWRYFEFSDGTPFIPVGPGPDVSGQNPDETDAALTQVGENSANFSRTWMSGDNLSGSSWAPWTGHIDYEGNYPGTSLTTDEAYGNGIYSLTLPQTADASKRCAFYGTQGVNPAVKPNTNYRVAIRLKTIGLTGNGGFTFRILGIDWPDTCDQFASRSLIIPYVTGTHDWQVVTGIWNSGSQTKLGNALITLENVTGGRVYLDEISIREDLGNGSYGPEILHRSNFNVLSYFSQEPSWNWDYALERFAQIGTYDKPVIEEKGDFAFNHVSPYGYGYSFGGQMQQTGAPLKYQEYFWRYLTARFGYSRAIHSWEYVNEDAPGSLRFPNIMAGYIHSIDPNHHMATSSFWCCISSGGSYYWQDPNYPNIDYADSHSYVTAGYDDTTWLSGLSSTNPFIYNNVRLEDYHLLGQDTALYVLAHSLDVFNKHASGNKPIIMGEAGVGYNGVTAGENDTDSQGVWLHQFLWSQVNHGAMSFLYWFPKTIRNNGFYTKQGFFITFRRFMEGSAGDTINKRIPINNGHYQDIALTLPTGLYGWGQKDMVSGGAYLWVYDNAYRWTNLNGGTSVAGKTISFFGLPAKAYVVETWNTWTGAVTGQNVNHPGGLMTLTIPANFPNKDVAIKIIPATGFPGPILPPRKPGR